MVTPIGKASNLSGRLSNQMVAEQCIKTCDVSARIELRQEVFRPHSLEWAILSMRVPCNETSPQQTTKFGIQRVQSGLRGVRKFGDRKNHLSVRGTLFGEEVLPVQNFHSRQTRLRTVRTESRTVFPPPPVFICCAMVGSICSSMTF